MIFTISLLIYIVIKQEPPHLQDYEALRVVDSPKQEQREPRLGDGCYHIFLDVGANVGVHGRFLLEPEKYSKSPTSVPLFKKEYPGLDNRDVCVFAFEANPKHWPRLREISEAYAAMGWRYHPVEAAVSDKSGTTVFYHQGNFDEAHNEWGFSGAKDLKDIYGEQKAKGRYTEEVVTIRLSDWINTHIHERLVPETLPSRKNGNGGATPLPIMTMKMDIEGFEYVVLPDLIHSGAICDFQLLFGEFHDNFAPIQSFRDSADDKEGNDRESDGYFNSYHRISLETRKESLEYAWALKTVMESSRHCQVRFLDADDETYLLDKMPLPSPAISSAVNA